MFLQLFAGSADTDPAAGGNQPVADAETPAAKTYTEDEFKAELKKAADAAAAKTRKAVEAEFKPKLEEAQKAVEAAEPFLKDPPGYITQFLAQNPALIKTVADGVDRMMSGQAPTQAQINAVGKAADAAEDPKVAKRLETLEAEMKATRQAAEETQTLTSELKAFAKEATAAGLEWNEDAFTAFVNSYADENGIGDDDPIDTRLLFRLYVAEQKNEAGTKRRAPRLPGGAPPPAAPKQAPKSWDEATAAAEALLRGAASD